MLKNEVESLQVAVRPEGGALNDVSVTVEPVSELSLAVYQIGNIKFSNNQGSDYLLRQHSSGKLPYLSLAGLTSTTDIKIAGNALTAGYDFCKDAPANHTLKAAEGFTITTNGSTLNITPN